MLINVRHSPRLELLITLAPPFRLAPGSAWRWEAMNIWGPDRLDLKFTRE